MPRKTRKQIVTAKAQRSKSRVDIMPTYTHGKHGKDRIRHERRRAKQHSYYEED